MTADLIEVFMVTRPDCGKTFCIYRTWEAVKDGEFEDADEGDVIYVTKKSMTQAELDSIPEFEGW